MNDEVYKYFPDIDYTKITDDESLLKECHLSEIEINKILIYLKDFNFLQNRNKIVRETSVDPDSSPSGSESLPKSIYDLDLRRLDPNPEIPEDEKYKEEDLKNAYPDKYERFEKDGEDYSFRYWLYKELDK